MKPAPALITILMPLRNAAATVRRALDSILAKTWQEWELVAVDDGSVETAEIVRSAARVDSRIRLVSSQPQGIARTLQVGCEAATGGWIARMDGDDWMHPERLAAQWKFCQKNPQIDVISCLVGYGGDSPGYPADVAWIDRLLTPEQISLRRFVEAPVAHPSVMFRRDLLEKHGGYRDGDFPEDYELWLRWLEADASFGKVPRELIVWNDPPDLLSRTDPRYSVEHFFQMKCGWVANWLLANVDPGRELWLWDAGRVTRRRFDALEQVGCRFEGFIDEAPKKANHRDGRQVVMADALPEWHRAVVIVGAGKRGARDKIGANLTSQGRLEGRDFLLAA